MTLNLATMTNQRPNVEHGALAAAQLPRINAGDAAALMQQATALGFAAVGQNQYSHSDGSWVALNPARANAIERGYQGIMFRGIPLDITQLPAIPVAQVGTAAVAWLPASLQAGPASAALTAAGFQPILANFFSHPDGSWVAIVAGTLIHGFGNTRVGGVGTTQAAPAPATPARRPGRATQTPAATPPARGRGRATQTPVATATAADQSASLPQVQPNWHDGFLACAQLPRLQAQNLANDRATFVLKGFSEPAPGLFQHPDGSWVAYAGDGRIERGLGNQRFQGVPAAPNRMAAQQPQAIHLSLAIAQPMVATLTASALAKSDQSLLDAGFKKVKGQVYEHTDKSVVALVDGQILFAAGQQLLSGPPTLANIQTVPVDLSVVANSAPLWDLPKGPAAAKAELAKRGFTEVRPGFFQSGTLWAALEGRTLHCGNGTVRYASIPSLAQLPRIKPDVNHGWLAVVQTSQIKTDQPNLPQHLGGLGFQRIGQGFYQHADGSWVALHNGQLLRGLAGQVFTEPPTAPPPGSYPVFNGPNPPANSWIWFQQNTALGRTPVMRVNDQATRDTIAGLGYARVGTATSPERWQHPDGSWVELGGSAPVLVGFQKWQIGDLPFQR